MVKRQKPIVDTVVAHLGTNVAHDHAWQGPVGVEVADLHHKGVGAVVAAAGEEAGHEHDVGCGFAQATRPPL